MQDIIIYLRAGDIAATVVDEYNQTIKTAPTITRGIRANLGLRLVDSNGDPVPVENLDYVSWDFVIANDWNTETDPQIRVQSGITVTSVLVGEITYSQINVPLTETNTEQLITVLGNNAYISIGAELAGFESGESDPGFLIQFDLRIRNRRGTAGTGTPVPVGDGNYSASQVDALLRAGLELQFSIDGSTNWHEEQTVDDRFYQYRYPDGEWSIAVAMVEGEKGNPGENAPQVQLQFSVDGASDWHSLFSIGDLYQRISTDGGTTWSAAIKFVGEDGSDGTNGADGTDGADGADGEDAPEVQYQFSIDGSTDWHSTFTSGDLYQRISTNGGTTWGSAIKFIGEDGADGIDGTNGTDGEDGTYGENAPEVQYQFSIDGSTDWHSTFTVGDFYQRISTDGGTTWSGAVKFVGEDGSDGDMVNPMTAPGDIIYGGTDGAPTKLAKGSAGQILKMNSAENAPEWGTSPSGNGDLDIGMVMALT